MLVLFRNLTAKKFLALIFCGAAAILLSRVNCFEIVHFGGDAIFSSPVPTGWTFTTRYIHSFQLTPVEEEYKIFDGEIWQWEERVQSHNAGLPTEAPPRGRFIVRSPWFIVQGGEGKRPPIVYRVGNSRFGKNLWTIEPYGTVAAYKMFPNERVVFLASKKILAGQLLLHHSTPPWGELTFTH